MQLEELRLIVLNERESGKLSDVPVSIFKNAQQCLAGLHQEAYREAQAMDGFLTGRARDMLEEINSIKETLQDIVRLRSRKILMLALVQAESKYVDREEIRKMLPSEKAMFEAITGALHSCRGSLLDYGAEGTGALQPASLREPAEEIPAPPLPPAGETEQDECIPRQNGDDAGAVALVRVLEDIEPFMGVDGRIYHLGREDLVTLPRKNADVLCERNIALNIRFSK
jgi:DNA replication factor GINS